MKAVILDFNRTLFDPDTNQLFPESFSLLQELKNKNFDLALISIGAENREEQIKPISSFFKIIKIVKEKNAKDFLEIVQELKSSPQEFLVIGDRVRGEIKIGNSLGMKTIWIRWGKFSSELPLLGEEPDLTLNNLSELITFLKEKELNQIIGGN